MSSTRVPKIEDFLKKEISSNIVKTKTRAKKMKINFIVVTKKILIIYF